MTRPINRALTLLPVTGLLTVTGHIGAAEITAQKNEESGLYSWVAQSEGFSIELIQLLPDFIRAIYMAHEFPDSEVEDIASYCVFGTIIKNTSNQQLDYDVADWYYTDKNGKQRKVKTKTEWLEQWRKAGVVFSWTLLPDKGTFYEGDWQQGFTTVKLPRESEFTLTYKWSLNGKEYTDQFEGLRCAPEQLAEQ
ncbi:MAG: hypothetical protein JSW45_10060 [Thiotrichales bacterium]|nr:MAG: hypothetical protein JSW45_10060 [Thiotrichales bacterium]